MGRLGKGWDIIVLFGTLFLYFVGTLIWYSFGTLLVHGAVEQSIALMVRLGGRLGGIWGYAAVCAITGQGGIILGRY